MKCTKLIPVRSSMGGVDGTFCILLFSLAWTYFLAINSKSCCCDSLKINTKITEINNFKCLNSTEVYFGVCIYMGGGVFGGYLCFSNLLDFVLSVIMTSHLIIFLSRMEKKQD